MNIHTTSDSITIGIIIAIVIVVATVARGFIFGPGGKLAREREARARELEISIRMGTGLDVIRDFNELAQVYLEMNRKHDAESCLQKALALAESQYGINDPILLPILENQTKVLSSMKRDLEAGNIKKRIKEIKARSA